MRGANWIVWLAPLALLALGGFILRGVFRKKAAPVEQDRPITDRDQLPDDPRLARYVLEARELAYGWPGGVSPDHRA
jgi:cytochrome c-type biogenesis protein CcmH/NrfF